MSQPSSEFEDNARDQQLTVLNRRLESLESTPPSSALVTTKLHHARRLLERATESNDGICRHLIPKIEQILTQLETPASPPTESKDRDSIQHMAAQLLRQLTQDLTAPHLHELPADNAQALDDELLALEEAAREKQQLAAPEENVSDSPLPRLKSIRRYRQLAAQQKTASMVNRAILTRPENPGPLNPHMLAIRSLTNMRDLSPAYLNRFVSYIETVLWLEEHIVPKTDAKDAGKKGRKKT